MKNEIKIYLAAPRGFCAGVDRAIEIVKKALDKYGSPVYVRHDSIALSTPAQKPLGAAK